MIAHVYVWQNGQVMVFDEHGKQMPDFQGASEEMIPQIRAASSPETEWHGGDWNAKITWPIDRPPPD